MKKGIIAKKIGMTQIYDGKGILNPVTVLLAGPCTVLEVKNSKKHGYSSVQIGFGKAKAKNVSKPIKGHCKAAGLQDNPPAKIMEIRLDSDPEFKPGDQIKTDIFSADEFVDVVGTSKGKGFQGVVKRWNFGGGRASHGGAWTRRTGSIGCKERPGNIIKGKKMHGHLGNQRVTVQNLKVVRVEPEENLIYIKGAVPGANGSFVLIKNAIKKTKTEGSK
ncbi:MAG TPA: 50S ribosomal protein L3 [Victivallales bacterium]|nr:50S ribosomal protein L3 [Victivallales bacterium]